MHDNYKMLPIASKVFKTLAWTGFVLGIISAVIIFAGIDESSPRWMGGVTLIAGAVYFFIFFVAAEAIKLMLDMSTRIK